MTEVHKWIPHSFSKFINWSYQKSQYVLQNHIPKKTMDQEQHTLTICPISSISTVTITFKWTFPLCTWCICMAGILITFFDVWHKKNEYKNSEYLTTTNNFGWFMCVMQIILSYLQGVLCNSLHKCCSQFPSLNMLLTVIEDKWKHVSAHDSWNNLSRQNKTSITHLLHPTNPNTPTPDNMQNKVKSDLDN